MLAIRVFLLAFLLLAFQVVFAQNSAKDTKSNTAHKSGSYGSAGKEIDAVHRLYNEAFNQGKVGVIDELVDVKAVDHEMTPGVEPNREGLKKLVGMYRSAFPDLHIAVDDIFTSGDKVVARVTISGTQKGQYMDMAPTGKTFKVEGIDIIRFANGKMIEHWGVTDNLAMMQQLGAVPAKTKVM